MIAPGTHIGKYRIVHKLGAGGMADVYCAEDTVMGRQVALKALPPEFARDPERVARFEKEVRNLAALEHPHIVTIYDVGHANGCHYYTMALLSGGDLKQRIVKGMRPDQALAIVGQMAEALGYAHAKGLIHRDIKPENILFDDRERPLLTDLGIAKAIGAGTQMTKTGMSIGTPHYMSPEQARGKAVYGRSDLYSLGVILYEMLTGAVPYHAEDTFAVALKHVNDPLPELPGHLAVFQPLIDRLMAKDPNERFADARALMGAIDHLQSGRRLERPASATRVIPSAGAPPRPASPATGGGLKWALGGALLALLIAVGVIYHQSRDSAPVMIGAGPGAMPAATEERHRFPVPVIAPADPAGSPFTDEPRSIKIETKLDAFDKNEAQRRAAEMAEPQRRETEQADARRRASEQAEAQRREQQTRIEQLLGAAEQDIAALRLTLPADNNALDKYRRVLSLDAGNARAQEGLSRIVSRYIELSDTAIGNRDFDRARTHLTNARNIQPNAPGLPGAEQRLTAARAAQAEADRLSAEAEKVLAEQRAREAAEAHRLQTYQAHIATGRQAVESNDKAEAVSAFEAALALYPGDPTAQIGLARAHQILEGPKLGDRFTNSLGMEFVFIPPGSFDMGSPAHEEGRDDEERLRRVTLTRGFWLQTTEVTQAQWRTVMGENPSRFSGCDKCPVERVSWDNAQEFIKKLSALESKTYRLPTEAQWEYAARADTRTPFAFGHTINTNQANFDGDYIYGAGRKGLSRKRTTPAASFAPNAWGLYDMHGNVWEWCQDRYGPIPSGSLTDPTGPASGIYRVIRGGSWYDTPTSCRSANRNGSASYRRLNNIGFRVALPDDR